MIYELIFFNRKIQKLSYFDSIFKIHTFVRGVSRLPARSVLLPLAEVSTGHPHPLKPPKKQKRRISFYVRNFNLIFDEFSDEMKKCLLTVVKKSL